MVDEQESQIILKKKLACLLHERSITAAELSRRSRVPKQTISDWLGGSPPRNLFALRRIAKVFEITIEALIFDDDILGRSRYQNEDCAPREASERLVLDHIPGFNNELIAVSEGGIVRFVSPALQEILGEQNVSLRGRSIYEFIHVDDLPSIVSIGDAATGPRSVAMGELRVLNMRGDAFRTRHRTLILGQSLVAIHYLVELKQDCPGVPSRDLFDVSLFVQSIKPYFSMALNASFEESAARFSKDPIFACSPRPLFARLLFAIVHDLKDPQIGLINFTVEVLGGHQQYRVRLQGQLAHSMQEDTQTLALRWAKLLASSCGVKLELKNIDRTLHIEIRGPRVFVRNKAAAVSQET